MHVTRRYRLAVMIAACAALLSMIPLFFLDTAISRFAMSWQTPGLVGVADAVSVLGNPVLYIIPGTIAFIIFKLQLPSRVRASKALVAALAPTVAAAVSDLGKMAIGRPRPLLSLAGQIAASHPFTLDHDYWSFPSEHAAVAVAAAAAASLLVPDYQLTLFGLAVLVACARLVLGMHYPTDLLAGVALGLLTFVALTSLLDWFDSRPRRDPASGRESPPPDLTY